MKLHFLGANRQVTGSRYCLEVGNRRLMVDCGLFQEREFKDRNWEPCPLSPDSIDALVLTHAHIDHCGLVPRLVKDGFKGPVYATEPTADLLGLMWEDSARIQEEDAKYKQKRHKKEGKVSPRGYAPLYDEDDAQRAIERIQPLSYYTTAELLEGVTVTFHDAGHILGSSSVEVTIEEHGTRTKVIFSGDIGQAGKPIIRDPSTFAKGDYLIMESTYGDREHRESGDIEAQLADVINATVRRGGKVIIPTFAVERAQELVYYINDLTRHERIPEVPVFLDSPMAVDATEIFRRHRKAFDAEAWALISSGESPLRMEHLTMSRTAAQSKAINSHEGPAIIMSTSGMCTAGRIKHHLKRNLPQPDNTVLFVGYQGRGTLGRLILEGREKVRIHGKEYPVRAEIAQIYGFSGHADRSGLLDWQGSFQIPPKQVFLTHGEEEAALDLAEAIRAQGWQVAVPAYQEIAELGRD